MICAKDYFYFKVISMKKIAFFNVDEDQQIFIQNCFKDKKEYEIEYYRKSIDQIISGESINWDGIGVFIQSRINKKTLDLLPQLKVIATLSTGFDHIDLEECKKRGITVSNVPAYGDNTVAEYAFGLVLALARKLKPTFNRVERGIFNRNGLMGMDIAGKTLGVIGTGKIGSQMVKYGHAFGMKVVAHDLVHDSNLEKSYGVEYVELEDLCSISDVISLHVPYNESTMHLINNEIVRLFKPGVLLVNTSRGKVVDTEAIVDALRDDKLGGVALDAFEGEEVWIEEEFLRRDDLPAIPLQQAMESFYMLRSERVILTPHNAFNTKEALDRILETSADNIISFFQGEIRNEVSD